MGELFRIFFCLATLILAAVPAAAEIGRVKMSAGIASIERKGVRVSPAVGTSLLPGDVLITGKGGQIAVTFADNTRFAVGPNARVTLDRFEFDRATRKGAFETRIDRGRLAVISGQIAKSKRGAMKIKTPTTLLGVIGTRFVMDVPE